MLSLQMGLRLVLSLTSAELESGRPLLTVPIIASGSYNKFTDVNKVPPTVHLPRSNKFIDNLFIYLINYF